MLCNLIMYGINIDYFLIFRSHQRLNKSHALQVDCMRLMFMTMHQTHDHNL